MSLTKWLLTSAPWLMSVRFILKWLLTSVSRLMSLTSILKALRRPSWRAQSYILALRITKVMKALLHSWFLIPNITTFVTLGISETWMSQYHTSQRSFSQPFLCKFMQIRQFWCFPWPILVLILHYFHLESILVYQLLSWCRRSFITFIGSLDHTSISST